MNLERFARTMVRRRRRVVAAWAALLVVVSVAASLWGGDHRVDYSIPGSDSAAAHQFLHDRIPALAGDTARLVFIAPEGLDHPDVRAAIAAARAEAERLEHVVTTIDPTVGADGTIGLVLVQFDVTSEHLPTALGQELIDLATRADTTRVAVEAGGAVVEAAEGKEAGSEQVGMIAALVILLVAFGSVLAAGLPLITALFGVGVALGLGSLLNHVVMVPEWAPQLVSMIGIGVGIDYALFVVVRYRAALAQGLDPEDAVVQAICTSGRAVLFAGGTVVVSLLGLCAMGMTYLYGTAAVMVSGVLVVVLASITLLPALLGMIGRRIDRLHVPFVRGDRGEQGLWARWSRVVQRRPSRRGRRHWSCSSRSPHRSVICASAIPMPATARRTSPVAARSTPPSRRSVQA